MLRRLVAPHKSVDLVAGVTKSQFFVQADERRLQQILINLFSNSIKFTDNGNVRLDAAIFKEDPTMLVVRVSDTGIGIHPKYHKYVGHLLVTRGTLARLKVSAVRHRMRV